jgi:hypothetical protein
LKSFNPDAKEFIPNPDANEFVPGGYSGKNISSSEMSARVNLI